MKDETISSAEMTAYWRSQYPTLSGDTLSVKLASREGIQKAKEFEEKYAYPLIGRKISVRAGWCLQQAIKLLKSGKYDSCISLGSGFSLLTYHAAIALASQKQAIQFFDVDLPSMISIRKKRIEALALNAPHKLETLAIDLETACREGKKINTLFPVNCKAPIFIMEGIIYFLSKNCVRWIYENIANYKNVAIIFDYWPTEGPKISRCFHRVLGSLDNFIPEQVQGLMSKEQLTELCRFGTTEDISLQEVEKIFSQQNGEAPQLVNQEEFIPVRLAIASR